MAMPSYAEGIRVLLTTASPSGERETALLVPAEVPQNVHTNGEA